MSNDTTANKPLPSNPILAAFAAKMQAQVAAKAKADEAQERATDQRKSLTIGHRARMGMVKQASNVAGVKDLLLASGNQYDRHVQSVRDWLVKLPSLQGLQLGDGTAFTLHPSDLAAVVVASAANERTLLSLALAVGEAGSDGRLGLVASAALADDSKGAK
jgi:hypothetical protein